MAASSADSAEMAHVQRMVRVCPPRRNRHIVSADVREQGAENAKLNAKTRGSKDAKKYKIIRLKERKK